MIPVMNTKGSAPENLLKVVQCACLGNCRTLRCSCRRSGLLCTKFCKYCGGESCSNISDKTVENTAEIPGEENDDDDEDMSRNEFLDNTQKVEDPPEVYNYEEFQENEQEDDE
ncbi:uncharacterized protein LOC122523246 [Polistes fuscatus]|uniref:uncharacterized protein LOC122523246 n=1 Tax=Polistes fuscatus TaxID=30207 RepID=UPI001CA7F507|nr:uncharacterized protein LOC122523246 [Polistes fuscatus]